MPAPYLLIVGPEVETRQRLADILAGAPYEVVQCRGDQLAADLAARTPDLLVILEETGAVEPLIRGLKNEAATWNLPIIVAFTEFSETAAAWALEVGADEFLLPPFDPQGVLARVAVVLRLQHDRRLLLASHEEFSRIFQETGHPLFFCDRWGSECRLNPALRRLLGYPGKHETPVPLEELLYAPEDQERLRRVLSQPGEAQHVKLHLVNRQGQPVTVLINDLALKDRPEDVVSFQVKPVGSPSPLKRALQGLVEHLLPSARDYLALMQMTPLLGGRYEKIKKLGQGNFGEVWLVVDTEATGSERRYVAKIPFLRAANAKFRKEAAICQKLDPHPGVACLMGTLEDDGKLIIIQEYVEGKTLGDLLDQELPRPLVERIILQLIEVVAHAHQNRIMHRDIKPNNIIIQPNGNLKLLDFGAAKMLGEKEISATMVGSRPFMAPEQIMGQSERRSDIWAIGVLMYLLYTGELPFYSEVEKLLIDQILEQEPVPPREENPEIPPALEAIILRCLKKKVEERYPSAVALRDDLLRQFPHYGTQTGRWPWIH
ncbi:MAG: protein kinase [Syntrophobacterales bacterium]|nr:protein kinase [Syntrophobacterales bacterium]